MSAPQRRGFLVEYDSGVAAAERALVPERKDITRVSGWSNPSYANRDNVETNSVSVQAYTDASWDVEQAAAGLSATYACVNFWAGNIAGLPLSVYRKDASGIPVEDPGHRLYWLLHTSPNYDQSAFDFWEYVVASIEMQGNAYAEIERRADGFIVSLTPIPPHCVQVRRIVTGELEYRWRDGQNERVRLQGDILHIRGPLGTPLGGTSPLQTLRTMFVNALSAERAAGTMFRNGVRPSGVLATDKTLTAEQRKVAETLLQEKFVGAQNAGRPMLLDSGLAWTQLTIDPVDAQMLESRYFGLEEIARAFEVDPHLIGHTHGNTTLGSSISDQTLSLMKFKMRKRLKRIEGALEKQLLTRADRDAGVTIEFNVEGFLRADSKGRADYYAIMKDFMTTNEIRKLEGLPPVDGGDVLMKQMQDVPLAQAVRGTQEDGQ